MPAYIPCANTYCDRPADKLGDVCKECKEHEQNEAKDWRGRGWSRYSNNRDAKPGHKGEGKNGK